MKKIFKCLGLFCLSVAVVIGSFFVTKKETKIHIASADSSVQTYVFNGSNTFIPTVGMEGAFPVTFQYNINFSNSTGSILVDFSNSYFLIPSSLENTNFYRDSVYINSAKSSRVLLLNVFDQPKSNLLYSSNENKSYYVPFYYKLSRNFNCNVYKIVYSYDIFLDSNIKYNIISYYDNNDNVLSFAFDIGTAYSVLDDNLKFTDRTYFLSNSLSDNQIYDQGYQQGLADNQQNIYNNGFNAGKIVGYNNGKTDGIASANNYSFIGLIGAVFDAPLQTFKGLLNFNILGINLLDFALSLITIALVVYIIRLIKGGR